LKDKLKEQIKESKEIRENILTRRDGQLEKVADNTKQKLNDISGTEKEPEVLQTGTTTENNGGSDINPQSSEGGTGKTQAVPEAAENTTVKEEEKLGNTPLNNVSLGIKNNRFTGETLQKLESHAKSIEEGKSKYSRFTDQEQDGFKRGGRIHEEASLVVGREEVAGIKAQDERTEREEKELERYAKKKGVWHDNTDAFLQEKYGEPFTSGKEAKIYDNGETVIKSKNTFEYPDVQHFLDGITLHNTEHPETSQKILGFGRNSEGDFVAIIEQPHIHAGEGNATKEEVIQFAKNKGYAEDEIMGDAGTHFKNDHTHMNDLHSENVIKTPQGNLAVIDSTMKLNETSGKRNIKNEISTKEQPISEPAYTTKNGKYTVSYEEGRRIVKNKNGKTPSESIQKKVLNEHAENYDYNNHEEIKSKPPQFKDEEEANRWVVENSTNPSEIADQYLRTPKEPVGLTSKEQAVRSGIDAGILGKVKESDYEHYMGVKAEGESKARAWFSNKSAPLDVIAKEISDHTGVEVAPEDILNFIDKFPNGEYQSRGERDTVVHQVAKQRFEELTGIPLTDKVARMAAKQYYTPEENAQAIIDVDNIPAESLPESEILKWNEEQSNFDNSDNLDNFNEHESLPENTGSENESESQTESNAGQSAEPIPQGTDASNDIRQPDNQETSTEQQQSPESSTENVVQNGLSIPYANELVEHDVKPFLANLGKTIRSAVDLVVRTLSPKTGVSEKAITHLMNALGSRNEAEQQIDKALGGFQKMFDKMLDSDRIDFIDRMKKGEPQLTPELQAISDMIKALDKNIYDEIIKYKPTLTWKENHYRVLWKVIPGSTTGKETFWSNLRRKPFQGSKGFMKQATLADMSEGIKMGGEPQTTNPIKMFKLAYADAMKYVTAQRMFEALKDDKMVKFVPFGKQAPEGFVPISDRMAKVYYPTPEGMVNKGEWYIEEGAGRLLNNHLSRDYIRESDFGKGLMNLKNLYTQVELGLSAFHAIAEGLETVSSDIGLGLRKMINLGTRGDFKSAAQGLKDILTSFAAPRSTYITGRRAIKLASVKDFENSPLGQKFLKAVPDAEQYIHDFFNGGGLMKQHDDLKASTIEALKEHAGKDNYIGAAIRGIPAMSEMIMNPLFNHYIPALKVGMFMKEFPVTLKENEGRLNKGQVTREQLARKTIDFIDDRLGEMNFDNLFWNRTFKTATQFMMRSVTWKLGNLRGMLGAPIEQAKEFYEAAREKRAPLLMPKMAWLFGLSAMQVALSAVIQKMLADKKLKTFKDVVAPQINPDDETERVIMPTYYKDMLHLWHSKLGYVTTSMSGNISKLVDIWNNKDFYGYEIHDEHDSFLQKRKDDILYFIPKPFSFSSASQMIERGEPTSKVVMSFFGLNKAPGYLTHTDIENEIFDLYNIRNAGIKPKDAKESNDTKKEIRQLYKEDKKDEAQQLADQAVKKGLLRPSQIKFLVSHVKSDENPSVFFFKELPFEDKKYLYEKMSDDEKKLYDPKGTFGKQVKVNNELRGIGK